VEEFFSVVSYIFCFLQLVFKSSSPDDAVAKVYDKYLYKSDLIGIVPKGSTARDSIAIIKNYINNWHSAGIIASSCE